MFNLLKKVFFFKESVVYPYVDYKHGKMQFLISNTEIVESTILIDTWGLVYWSLNKLL